MQFNYRGNRHEKGANKLFLHSYRRAGVCSSSSVIAFRHDIDQPYRLEPAF